MGTNDANEWDPIAHGFELSETPRASSHAERLARGSVLQQGAQVLRLVGGFLVVTLLARQLPFAELGTYTILVSMVTAVAFVKGSVMRATTVAVAETVGKPGSEQLSVIVSNACAVYTALGVVSGAGLCVVGLLILPVVNIPHWLYHEAQLGVVGLSVVTLLSWPLQIYDDTLRGLQRFAAVGLLESAAMVIYVAGAVALVLVGAPIWTLVTLNAGIPLLMGLACLLALRRLGVSIRVTRRLVNKSDLRRFGSFSGLLVVSGLGDLATYSLDRLILSAIRSPALVGRYEGPLAAQNVIRYLNGVLNAPAVPVTASFLAKEDRARMRELCLRGLRYGFAATLPFVVLMVVDAGPVLRVWLGARFASMAAPAALFCGWWFIGTNNGMIAMVLYGGRFARRLVIVSWVGAVVNVMLALALTSSLGVYGPIIGAIAGYCASLIFSFPFAMRVAGLRWREVAREAWLPAYVTALILAALLVGGRYGLGLTATTPSIWGTMIAAPLIYWLIYAAAWLRPDERRLALYAAGLRRSERGSIS